MTSECLRIRMNVIDDKNCIGPKYEEMIKIPKREYKAVGKTVSWFLLNLGWKDRDDRLFCTVYFWGCF